MRGSLRLCNFNARFPCGRLKSSAVKIEAKQSADANGDWGIYNFKAIIAYKGTAFKGWQIQNGKHAAPTIQQAIETALLKVKNENRRVMRIQGAGRTDAGVHARGQVINFYSNKLTPAVEKMVLALNAHLPADIRVLDVQRVPPDFSARYSALSKVYSYRIQSGKVQDPFLNGLSQHIHNTLNVAAMRRAAADFVGCHDFKQFSSIPASDPLPNPIKTLNRVGISDAPGGLLIEIDGSGFLYNQCRHMVGCLTQIGQGVMQAGDVARLLEIGSSEHPGLKYRGWSLAPAQGLYLEEVRFPPHDDPEVLMYPSLPHDEYGRVWIDPLDPGDEKAMIACMKQTKHTG